MEVDSRRWDVWLSVLVPLLPRLPRNGIKDKSPVLSTRGCSAPDMFGNTVAVGVVGDGKEETEPRLRS